MGKKVKRVLITGAGGWIGSYCVPKLEAKGYEVLKCDWDLLKLGATRYAFTQFTLKGTPPTHLLHLAWDVTPGTYLMSKDNYLWVEASSRLLSSFILHGGKRVVTAGTCFEGRGSVYGLAKQALFDIQSALANTHHISSAWAKIHYVYGPGEKPQRFIPTCITRALSNLDPIELPYSTSHWDLMHVEDVASALVKLLDSKLTGSIDIGTGQTVNANHIGKAIQAKVRGKKFKLEADSGFETWCADVSRLRDELKWKPKVNLSAGLDEEIAYFRGRGEQ